MLTKIIVLFLIAMAVLAMFGGLRRRGRSRRLPPPAGRPGLARPRLCPSCNSLVVGRGPCPCGAEGGAGRG